MASSVPPNFPSDPQAPFSPQQPLPPGKKSNILIWLLGGIVVLVLGSTLMCGVGGYLLLHKAKESGFDSSLMQKNPVYAAAKMAATVNPDVEVLSSDDSSGTIHVRDKKSGKTTTLKFDADKKQMIVIDGEGKQATISVTGEGDKASLNIQSGDGNAKFSAGGENQSPAWVPVYPGSKPTGTYSGTANGASQSAFTFKTSDAPAKVMDYYQEQLKTSGFKIMQTFSTAATGMMTAENGNRTITLTTTSSGSETSTNVIAVEKQ